MARQRPRAERRPADDRQDGLTRRIPRHRAMRDYEDAEEYDEQNPDDEDESTF